MANESEKKHNKNKVLFYIKVAVILLFCYAIAGAYIPFPKLHLPTLLDRLVFTLRWLMVSLLTICVAVIVVGNIRFATSAINPLDPEAKKFTELSQRCLQNTVEQFLLHAFSLLALSTYLSEENMHWIPLLVVLFVIARAMFFVGYSIDHLKRVPGFTMTMTSNVFVCGYCLYCMFVYGVQVPH